MAMEDLAFIRGFCRLCDDGFKQGWHERNGGNLTYRMTDEEAAEAKPFLRRPASGSRWACAARILPASTL